MSDHTSSDSQRLLASQLSPGAQLFIFSARHWLVAAKSKHCIQAYLTPFHERLGAQSALPVLDELMCNLAMAAFRPVQVHCPCRTDLADDEQLLLHMLQALQRGDRQGAIDLAGELLSGAMATTFIRVAQAYVAEIRRAQLSLTGMRYLCAVEAPAQPQAARQVTQ